MWMVKVGSVEGLLILHLPVSPPYSSGMLTSYLPSRSSEDPGSPCYYRPRSNDFLRLLFYVAPSVNQFHRNHFETCPVVDTITPSLVTEDVATGLR